MNEIKVSDLGFSYKDKNVIKDITFTIGMGETWAIIGRNGVGKSTLLKCLCGLLKYRRGAVFINGADAAKLSPRDMAKQIAYVPQGVNRPIPPFTVREYAAMARFPYMNFGAFLFNLSISDKKRVEEALNIADIPHIADRMMGKLSGGEFQAALIAGAIAQETPFLFLDEPTTYLDPYHQENVRRLIERIHIERGVAVVTVTHDVNFALLAHSNILALIDGEVFFSGTKNEFCVNAESNLSKIFSVAFRAVDVERPNGKTISYLSNGFSA